MANLQNYDNAPQSIRDFIYYEQIVKGRSELTVKNYFNDLRTFFRFYKIRKKGAPEEDFSKIDISDITDDDIKSVDFAGKSCLIKTLTPTIGTFALIHILCNFFQRVIGLFLHALHKNKPLELIVNALQLFVKTFAAPCSAAV